MNIKEKVQKLTGILYEKLMEHDLYSIIKDNNTILNITDKQREKLSYIKDMLQHQFEVDKINKITGSKDVYETMKFLSLESDEHFYILLLKRNNAIIKKQLISKGGVSGTVVDLKVIAQEAIINKACSVILCHNHPSGNNRPSEQDIQLTKKVKDGLKLLDVNTLDHIIINNNNYYSFADEGNVF
jgi:DNA repair protein RadC